MEGKDVITTEGTLLLNLTTIATRDVDGFFGGFPGKNSPYTATQAILIALVLGTIIVGTVIGNILVCVAVFLVRKLRRPCNYLLILCHNEATEIRGEKDSAADDRLRQPGVAGRGLHQPAAVADYGERAHLLRHRGVALRCLSEFLLSDLRHSAELLYPSLRHDPGLLQDILRGAQDSPGGEEGAEPLGGSLLSRHRARGAAAPPPPPPGPCEPSIKHRHTRDPRKPSRETAPKFQRLDDVQRPRGALFRRRAAQEQRVAVPDAAEAGEADPLVVDGDHAADDVDEIDDREEPPEQHVQRDELAAPEEAEVPPGQGAEGQHHPGHHNERVHRLLAAVLRAGVGQTVPGRPGRDTRVPVEPVPLAGLLQQPPEPDHLRDAEQGLPQAVPRDPLLPLQQPEPHDEGGVLPEPVRRPRQQLRDQGGRDGRRRAPRQSGGRGDRRRSERTQREFPVIRNEPVLKLSGWVRHGDATSRAASPSTRHAGQLITREPRGRAS
nr:uncharacterized protein LOC116433599 isoform X4 [Nomia melanderi]